MSSKQISDFLRNAVRSVWALEALILLRREPERLWTPDALTRELRSSLAVVAEVLGAFKTNGIVEETAEGVRYRPASAEIDRLAGEVERAYAERPMALIKEIVSAPNEKLQSFADAFKLKRD